MSEPVCVCVRDPRMIERGTLGTKKKEGSRKGKEKVGGSWRGDLEGVNK